MRHLAGALAEVERRMLRFLRHHKQYLTAARELDYHAGLYLKLERRSERRVSFKTTKF
jgi:hypothetical protein